MRISDWSSDVCSSDLLTPDQPFTLIDYQESQAPHAGGYRLFVGKIALNGEERTVSGRGNCLISSVLAALRENCGIDLEVEDYSEHALGQGSDVQAAAYVECKTREGQKVFGVGMDADVATADRKSTRLNSSH